jgi:hypothetical protein
VSVAGSTVGRVESVTQQFNSANFVRQNGSITFFENVDCGPKQFNVVLPLPVYIEYAYTRVANVSGSPVATYTLMGQTWYDWRTTPWCGGNIPVWGLPDWDPLAVADAPAAPQPFAWDSWAYCAVVGAKVLACQDLSSQPAIRYNTQKSFAQNCMYLGDPPPPPYGPQP